MIKVMFKVAEVIALSLYVGAFGYKATIFTALIVLLYVADFALN